MKNHKGLTLIELLVVLAVLAVIIAIGAPRMDSLSSSNRQTTAVNKLVADLSLARNEAVNRNATIRLITQNGGGDWSGGWRIETTDAVPVVLSRTVSIPAIFTFNGTVDSVTFNSQGTKAATGTDTFTLCKTNEPGNNGKQIQVNTTGKSRLVTGIACP